ncbi:hypothetical protein GCM10025867_02800 [Frondihabitans sucicola]|uniref:LapA family protein n=1 Tax=Frondihabitans sucicola TaxID=1268041 RepID=A0ABM8GI60_9MICO|nr:hypothetical protein [Frondihabitans sucicola]BDZ48039.1 hypothetical protein GCM10025867_02800 [Frondihabitans sucicola]
MSRSTAAGITAVFAVVAGVSVSAWAASTLNSEGIWTEHGIATGHLDFTVAAVLLIGLALLLTGLILLLATLADYWIDKQDLRDAQLEARSRRQEAERYRLAASLAETRPDTSHSVAH